MASVHEQPAALEAPATTISRVDFLSLAAKGVLTLTAAAYLAPKAQAANHQALPSPEKPLSATERIIRRSTKEFKSLVQIVGKMDADGLENAAAGPVTNKDGKVVGMEYVVVSKMPGSKASVPLYDRLMMLTKPGSETPYLILIEEGLPNANGPLGTAVATQEFNRSMAGGEHYSVTQFVGKRVTARYLIEADGGFQIDTRDTTGTTHRVGSIKPDLVSLIFDDSLSQAIEIIREAGHSSPGPLAA